jgi:hypothetical protein
VRRHRTQTTECESSENSRKDEKADILPVMEQWQAAEKESKTEGDMECITRAACIKTARNTRWIGRNKAAVLSSAMRTSVPKAASTATTKFTRRVDVFQHRAHQPKGGEHTSGRCSAGKLLFLPFSPISSSVGQHKWSHGPRKCRQRQSRCALILSIHPRGPHPSQ